MTEIGVIFDWDGVIVDSSTQHENAWQRLAKENGHALPHGFFLSTFGMINETIIPEILKWASAPEDVKMLSLRKEELYRDIVREDGLSPLKGVADWIRTLSGNDVARTIGSSTQRANIELSLEIMGLSDCFDNMITSENVSRGKPDPEVFLLAADLLKLPPEQCVVFEDTFVGIDAARAAGTRVVGVAGTHSREKLAMTDLVIDCLGDMTLERLQALFT